MIKTYLAYFFLGHGIHEQQIRKIHVNTFTNENNAEVFSWGGGTFFTHSVVVALEMPILYLLLLSIFTSYLLLVVEAQTAVEFD